MQRPSIYVYLQLAFWQNCDNLSPLSETSVESRELESTFKAPWLTDPLMTDELSNQVA